MGFISNNEMKFTITINSRVFDISNIDRITTLAKPENKEIYQQIFLFLVEWANDQSYIEVNTSGSTGTPKLIRLSKKSMLISAQYTCDFFQLNKQSNALLCLPVHYIAGKMMLVRAILSGLNLIVSSPVSNPLKDVNKEIDFLALTPYQVYNSLEDIKKGLFDNIIIGGAPVGPDLEDKLKDLTCNIYETYGMTETSSHIALRKISGADRSEWFKIWDDIKISTDSEEGLLIKVPYITDIELVTNDIVEIKEKVKFKWKGRKDNVINSGGIKIFPEQIEYKLYNVIDTAFYITSLKDNKLNEKVVLVIEGKISSTEKEKLFEKIIPVLNKHEIPKELIAVGKFERTQTGKIIRIKY